MNKDDNKKTHIIVTGKGGGGGSDAGAVRFDEAQTLTSAEQLQARENIGVPTEWFGTQAEYDLIDPKDPNTTYHIEGGQPVQSDWNEADSTSLAYIQSKPTIPAMATETLTFTLQGGTTKTVDFYVVPNYFYVEDISGSDNTLSITGSNSNPIEIFKSTDRLNWTSMGTTSSRAITATIPANSKLYIKATTTKFDSTHFSATGNHNVGGNSMSLFYGDNFDGKTVFPNSTSGLNGIFMSDTKLINAQNLVLPATTLVNYCYSNMFRSCTSLLTAPALPATTLESNCYQYMFYGCTSLTTAPALPATSNVANSCYSNMFSGCTSLNRMVVYATNSTFTTYCISNWLKNVAATGDFYNLGGITYPSGASGIPAGWTEHTSL